MAQTNILRVKLFLITTTKQSGLSAAKYPLEGLSGDHIVKVLPVPIPNTEVKLSEPMIVHTSVKVGIAGFLKTPLLLTAGEFFYALIPKTQDQCNNTAFLQRATLTHSVLAVESHESVLPPIPSGLVVQHCVSAVRFRN